MMHVVYQYKEECEHLRQQLATLNESLRITSEGNFKLREQLAECEREIERQRDAYAQYVRGLTDKLAECEAERDECLQTIARLDEANLCMHTELAAVTKERDKLLGHREALLIDLGASLTREEKYPCYPSGICKAAAIEAELATVTAERDELRNRIGEIRESKVLLVNDLDAAKQQRDELLEAFEDWRLQLIGTDKLAQIVAKLGADKTGEGS